MIAGLRRQMRLLGHTARGDRKGRERLLRDIFPCSARRSRRWSPPVVVACAPAFRLLTGDWSVRAS